MDGQLNKLSQHQSSPQGADRDLLSKRGKASRRKGQSSERELFGILSDLLGTCVRRNVDQARNGGADGLDVPGWAIECKRVESGFRGEWWSQAIDQAQRAGRRPALAYRASRQPWRVRLWLGDAVASVSPGVHVQDVRAWIETDLETFALMVRESIAEGG